MSRKIKFDNQLFLISNIFASKDLMILFAFADVIINFIPQRQIPLLDIYDNYTDINDKSRIIFFINKLDIKICQPKPKCWKPES